MASGTTPYLLDGKLDHVIFEHALWVYYETNDPPNTPTNEDPDDDVTFVVIKVK